MDDLLAEEQLLQQNLKAQTTSAAVILLYVEIGGPRPNLCCKLKDPINSNFMAGPFTHRPQVARPTHR